MLKNVDGVVIKAIELLELLAFLGFCAWVIAQSGSPVMIP